MGWTELLIAVLGLTTTGLTWYFKRKQAKPLTRQIKSQHEAYQILLAKYAGAVKERNTLRLTLKNLEQQLYEGYDLNDLIDIANKLPKWTEDGDN